jgi:putative redox protein
MDITVDFPGGARVDAHLSSLTVHTDQPKEAGGDNSAPSPFGVFLASLATCAGYYVYGFCKARGIPMDGIRVIQRAEQDPKTKMVGKISVEIQLPPDFPKEYASAVVRAAESCLVKKHLEKPPSFEVLATFSSAPKIA